MLRLILFLSILNLYPTPEKKLIVGYELYFINKKGEHTSFSHETFFTKKNCKLAGERYKLKNKYYCIKREWLDTYAD